MFVYMIQAGEGGPVKIGVARKPKNRLRALQGGHYAHLRMLRALDGNWSTERALHTHYARLRLRGEWFAFCPTMLTVDAMGLPAPEPSAGLKALERPAGRPTAVILERLGGNVRVAEICGISPRCPTAWKRSGIPVRHWRSLVAYAATNDIPGITFDAVQAARDAARSI